METYIYQSHNRKKKKKKAEKRMVKIQLKFILDYMNIYFLGPICWKIVAYLQFPAICSF